jgi:hypothetical protein
MVLSTVQYLEPWTEDQTSSSLIGTVGKQERCDPSGSARYFPRYCRSYWGGRIRESGMLEIISSSRAMNHGLPVEEPVRE